MPIVLHPNPSRLQTAALNGCHALLGLGLIAIMAYAARMQSMLGITPPPLYTPPRQTHRRPSLVAHKPAIKKRSGHVAATCGFGTKVECLRPYTIEDVVRSAAEWDPTNERHAAQLLASEASARAACDARSSSIARSGGRCLLPEPSGAAVNYSFAASDGRAVSYSLPPHLTRERGSHVAPRPANPTVVRLLDVLLKEDAGHPRRLLDLGAGVGAYGKALLALDGRHQYRGFDGTGNIAALTGGFVHYANLTKPLSLRRAHWVLSMETAERVSLGDEMMYVRNLAVHAAVGIVLSWAGLAQGRHGNVHNPPYVEAVFKELGFALDERASAALRNETRHKHTNYLVLRRREPAAADDAVDAVGRR